MANFVICMLPREKRLKKKQNKTVLASRTVFALNDSSCHFLVHLSQFLLLTFTPTNMPVL